MAEYSWTLREDGITYGTAYLSMATPTTVIASASSFNLSMPTVKLKFNDNYAASNDTFRYGLGPVRLYNGSSVVAEALGISSASYVKNNVYATASWTDSQSELTINTSSIFNASNNTSKTVAFTAKVVAGDYPSFDSYSRSEGAWNYYDIGAKTLGVINVTLNAPPTFTHSSISYDTAYIYTGLTTASVTVSDLSAKYGGNITDVTFTIGNQSVSRTTAGTLSILLDTVGTFTPTITVTDSRGQTATGSLDPITVSGYTAPVVSFTAERTAQNGTNDDEGAYATVDATFRYTDVVTTLVAPSVVLTDDAGTQTTPTVTWYKTRASDGTLSGAFTDWSTVAYGDTVYGLIPNLSTQHSYQISIRPRDTEGTGTAIIQTVAPAFYTIDFLAGGHGIAFGQPATNAGFECSMDALFHDVLAVDLDTTATSGTDYEIYDALQTLGWDSDVIV